MFFDRGNVYEFLSLGQELAAPGELQHPQTFPFNFKNVEKQYESYNGINVKLRYFVRVTVSRRMADVIREKDIWVYSYRIPPETNSSIKMDVGIEDYWSDSISGNWQSASNNSGSPGACMAAQFSCCWMARRSSVTRKILMCRSSRISSLCMQLPLSALPTSHSPLIANRCPMCMRFRNSLHYLRMLLLISIPECGNSAD
jgi:hypothetical protein